MPVGVQQIAVSQLGVFKRIVVRLAEVIDNRNPAGIRLPLRCNVGCHCLSRFSVKRGVCVCPNVIYGMGKLDDYVSCAIFHVKRSFDNFRNSVFKRPYPIFSLAVILWADQVGYGFWLYFRDRIR